MVAFVRRNRREGPLVRDSPYNNLLTRASRSADAVVAAIADNCRFDERASEERWSAFEALLPAQGRSGGAIAWEDWIEAHRRHLDQTCEVAPPSVPDAFLEINQGAWLDGLSENQSLVRVEDLHLPLQSSALALGDLAALRRRANAGDSDAELAVRLFFDVWNERRDARPTFAAFADEVQVEMDDDDWPHALRDRLGLGHYGPLGDTARPVALMRYPLTDVYGAQARQSVGNAVALPTVLDGGMDEFFFPVPREHAYGATVHLVPDLADTLTAEVVHCRLDYEPRHLYRLGEITHPNRLSDNDLREARDLHLLALQVACDRDDFGEELKGRT